MYRRLYLGSIALLSALFVAAPLALRAVEAAQRTGRTAGSLQGQWQGFYQGPDAHGGKAALIDLAAPGPIFGYLALDSSPLFNTPNFELITRPLLVGQELQFVGIDFNNRARVQAKSAVTLLNEGGGLLDGTFYIVPPNFAPRSPARLSLVRDFDLPPGVAAPFVAGHWQGSYHDTLSTGVLDIHLEQPSPNGVPATACWGTLSVSDDAGHPIAEFAIRGSIAATGQLIAIGQADLGRIKLQGVATIDDDGVAVFVEGVHSVQLLDGTTAVGTFQTHRIQFE
jgi:hypothetical protein